MEITIGAIGKMRDGPEQDLVDKYLKRISWSVRVREVVNSGSRLAGTSYKSDNNQLVSMVPNNSKLLCLDSRGRNFTSEQFADLLGSWRDDGQRNVTFLIGGADGLPKDVLDKAELTLSFGSATWPHLLCRVMLIEQLYRAHCIYQNHPYHKGH
ncbi:MAG: 23S rRNA (pseudouridine(1915)-N(3))-methyltransferase RlmH [Rhodospirillaceae bacterium]|nr:23S rRNA (pseudouridine(1915)-N(3))-methyltransferase RlmH [Rhodospirillaceae bacterium]